MQPKRLWSVLIVGAIGGVGGAIFGLRIARPGDVAGIAQTAVIVGLIGVALGVLVVAIMIPHDTRLLTLRARFPDAVVVQAVRDDETVGALTMLGGYPFNDLAVGWLFTVVFDRTGFSVWKGTREPQQVDGAAWSRVTELLLGDIWTNKSSRNYSYQRMRIRVTAEDGPVTLQFGVQRVRGVGFGRQNMNESELVDLIASVSAVRGGTTGVRQQTVATSNISAGLAPGRTAWAARRIGLIPVFSRIGVAQVFVLVGAVAIAFKWPIVATVIPFVLAAAMLALFFVGARLEGAADKREAAAGYTTLNGVNLAVEQRHPLTGVVIRPAGAQALSKAAFADLLRR